MSKQGRRRQVSTRGSQVKGPSAAPDLPLQLASKRSRKHTQAYQPVRQELLRFHSSTERHPPLQQPASSLSHYPSVRDEHLQQALVHEGHSYNSITPATNSHSHLGLFPQKLESLNNSVNSSTGEKRTKTKSKKSKMSSKKVAKKSRSKRRASPGDQASLADSLEEDNTFEREQTKK